VIPELNLPILDYALLGVGLVIALLLLRLVLRVAFRVVRIGCILLLGVAIVAGISQVLT
jgi:hypothetical protein